MTEVWKCVRGTVPRAFLVSTPVILVEGTLQKTDGTLSVKASRFEKIEAEAEVESHDWC
jgi:hypothetical protein